MTALALVAVAVTVAAFCVGWVAGGIVTNRRRRRIVAVQVAALRGGR